MMKAIIYKGEKVYNSKQVREFLSIEFDLLLHLFQENKVKFEYGKDYFYVDREKFAEYTGEQIKGTSQMIYLWTTSGIQLMKELIDSERQLTIWDATKLKEELKEATKKAVEGEAKKSSARKVAKVDDLDIYVPAEGLDVGDVARALQTKGIIKFGQNTLFRKLRNRGVLNSYNVPYQQYIKNDMFGIYIQEKKKPGGGEYIKCKVFEKGIIAIARWFGEEANNESDYGD